MSSVSFRGEISPLNDTDDISFLLSPAHHVISLKLSMAIYLWPHCVRPTHALGTSGDIHSEVRQLDIVSLKACATFSTDLCAKWFGSRKSVSLCLCKRYINPCCKPCVQQPPKVAGRNKMMRLEERHEILSQNSKLYAQLLSFN